MSALAPLDKPGVRAFAMVGAMEAIVRGIALSIYPLLMYRAWGEAVVISQLYFAVGLLSLLTGLMVPLLTRHVPRRWSVLRDSPVRCSTCRRRNIVGSCWIFWCIFRFSWV